MGQNICAMQNTSDEQKLAEAIKAEEEKVRAHAKSSPRAKSDYEKWMLVVEGGIRSRAKRGPGETLKALRKLRGYKTQKAFAEKFGIPLPTYNMHESGKRGIDVKMAKFYAKCLDVEWPRIFMGPAADEYFSSDETANDIIAPSDKDFVFVKEFDVLPSAGAGQQVDHENIKSFLSFRREWLRRVTQSSPSDLAVATIAGDSMEPTLRDGDAVLVDFQDRAPKDGNMYILRFGDDVQAKRLLSHPTSNLITVASDNPAHKDWPGIPADELNIIGRIIWRAGRV